jgi:hypothetical protein
MVAGKAELMVGQMVVELEYRSEQFEVGVWAVWMAV